MLHVHECPIHNLALIEQCGNCGAPFSDRYGSEQRNCERCSAPLWKQAVLKKNLSDYASWCQKQVLELVAFASNPESSIPSDWGERYVHSVTRLNEGMDGGYVRQERRFVRNIAEHTAVRVAKSAIPSLNSILRLASIQAVGVVDYLQAPVEHGSPRLVL